MAIIVQSVRCQIFVCVCVCVYTCSSQCGDAGRGERSNENVGIVLQAACLDIIHHNF